MKKSILNIFLYIFIRIVLVIIMISGVLIGNYEQVFMCVLTLILLMLPNLLNKKSSFELPNMLESIVLIFIFSSIILGGFMHFYIKVPHWDTVLHTINGFLCAAIGFSLINILNKEDRFKVKLSVKFVILFAFCFSMTIGIVWEIFEFSSDMIFKVDTQKDTIVTSISSFKLNEDIINKPKYINNIFKTVIYSYDKHGNITETVVNNGYLDIGLIDTMKDIIVNLIGAIVFSILAYFYMKDKEKYKFTENFLLKKKIKKE